MKQGIVGSVNRIPMSPPTRGRGLKQDAGQDGLALRRVAPHAGAWIETESRMVMSNLYQGRPPRGGVD